MSSSDLKFLAKWELPPSKQDGVICKLRMIDVLDPASDMKPYEAIVPLVVGQLEAKN